MTTNRVQLSRKKGWKMPAGAVKVDRKTEWGNPFKIIKAAVGWLVVEDAGGAWHFPTKGEAQSAAVGLYRKWLGLPANRLLRNRMRLRFMDKTPACWCRLDWPCHADVISEIAHSPKE